MANTGATAGEMHGRPRRVVVIGAGPAAHRLVDAVASRDEALAVHLTVVGEEPYLPYDRVSLSHRLHDQEDLTLQPSAVWDDSRVSLRTGVRAISIDRHERIVHTDDGERLPYDDLVLATTPLAS